MTTKNICSIVKRLYYLSKMSLKKILLAFEPPGLGLLYVEEDKQVIKHVNLIKLDQNSNTNELTEEIFQKQPLNIVHKNIVNIAITKIQNKILEKNKFTVHGQSLQHFLPITNIAVNNSGQICATSSYDRTAKIWDFNTGSELKQLEGHGNVVFSVVFNKNSDKLLTGSFDKTAKIWNIKSSEVERTFRGHTKEVICAKFLPDENLIATASLDTTLRTYQTETGQDIQCYKGHTKNIISFQTDPDGKFIISASFDKTLRLWDLRSDKCFNILSGHEAEVSCCKINNDGTLIVSGSFDGRTILWDLRMKKYYKVFPSATYDLPEILDVDLKDKFIGTCTTSGTANIWNFQNDTNQLKLIGHQKAISKICFNPTSSEIMTCSDDHTIRIWKHPTNQISKTKRITADHILEHDDAVFTGVYTKCGTKLFSACKNNTCKLWSRSIK